MELLWMKHWPSTGLPASSGACGFTLSATSTSYPGTARDLLFVIGETTQALIVLASSPSATLVDVTARFAAVSRTATVRTVVPCMPLALIAAQAVHAGAETQAWLLRKIAVLFPFGAGATVKRFFPLSLDHGSVLPVLFATALILWPVVGVPATWYSCKRIFAN
jgi:hypothetical protein